jgi:CBS domain containing-hemolysin-like protein
MKTLYTGDIVLLVIAGVLIIVFVYLSLLLVSLEAAVSRVTRAGLNNLILETQTDEDITKFAKAKRIQKIQHVQKLINNRSATASSAAFCRIFFSILCGFLALWFVQTFVSIMWIDLVVGIVFALVVGFLSVIFRPRSTGALLPRETLVRHSTLLSAVVWLTPFARINSGKDRAREELDDLSDDEEIEKFHLEQSKAVVDRMVEVSDFDPEVAQMLRGVVMLSDTYTREIMVPRTDMICVGREEKLSDALQLFSRSGFSRIPVIGESVDDLIGIAYLKDAVKAVAFNSAAVDRPVSSIARDPLFVPESKPCDDLFHQMQTQRQHIALVVDEYGGIAGLVTIEDAIEQIVGELEDEHDKVQRYEPEKIGKNVWVMPSRTPIADVEELFEITIDEDDVDTVYGLLTKLLGTVPIVGASAVTHGLRLTATDVAGRRKKVSMIQVEPAYSEHDESEDSDSDKDKKDKEEQSE